MEEKRSVFYHISVLFAIYGIIVLMFVILNIVMGEQAEGYSSIFEYGKKGMAIGTLIQLFFLALILCAGKGILFSDRLIRSMPMFVRNAIFFVVILATIVVFVIFFGWFPIDDVKAWIGFFVSFALCSTVAVILSRVKERTENERMNRALEKIKNSEK